MNKNLLPVFCSPLLLLIANSLHAKEFAIDSVGDVTIQESRLQLSATEQNRNVTIITKEAIAKLPVRSINEILSYVSGVDMRQRGVWGSQADVSIDGGGFDETLVLLNGVRLTDPQSGHNMMNIPVELADIERIEILRGAAARTYGLNALTGAINIVTKKAKQNGINVNSYTGSNFKNNKVTGNPYQNFGGNVRLTGSHGRYEQSLSGGIEHGNGYRFNTGVDLKKVYYQGRLKVRSSDELNFYAGYLYNDFGANGFYAAPGDSTAHESVKTFMTGVKYDYKVADFWILKPSFSYINKKDDYQYITTPVVVGENIHKSNIWEAQLNNTFFTSIGQLGLGLSARNERLNSTNLGKRDRYNYGLAGEWKYNKVNNLLITAGAYLNYNTDWGWQVFPGIDVGYNLTKGLKAYVNAGTAQRLPTYTDLYYKQSTLIIGNPNLKPEKSISFEGGLKYENGNFYARGAYFHRQITDFIDWVKNVATDPWQPQNFSKLITNGLTGAVGYTYTVNNPVFTALKLEGSYNYLSPKIGKSGEEQDKISRYAVNSLKDQLVVNVGLVFLKQLSFNYIIRYQKRISYKDYSVSDIRIQWDAPKWNIYLDGSNVWNATYIEAGAFPMPGRWITLGGNLKL